jgi:hypothetical protein
VHVQRAGEPERLGDDRRAELAARLVGGNQVLEKRPIAQVAAPVPAARVTTVSRTDVDMALVLDRDGRSVARSRA